MCGIAGFIGIIEVNLIERMLKTIRHRGPDALTFWVDPIMPLALGHVRLSILDLSERGAQPMWDDTGRFCITYNGEIYNYRELRSNLVAKGCKFQSNTDTEVLLTLFREKGPSCLKELNGIWAFGIWDSKERRLFLSRDPLGVKPLYFVVQGDKFLFSSEIYFSNRESNIGSFPCFLNLNFSTRLYNFLFLFESIFPRNKQGFSNACDIYGNLFNIFLGITLPLSSSFKINIV